MRGDGARRVRGRGPGRTGRGGACAAALLGAWVCVAAWTGPAPARADRGVEPLPVERVADGMWLHRGRHEDMRSGNGGDVANVGFVVGDASVAVIDPGGSVALARALVAAVRSVTDLPISHVVLTHAHPDHVLGAGAFDPAVFEGAGAGAPEIVAHARLARAVAARADASNPRYAFALEPGVPVAVRPTIELAAGEERAIDLGNRALRAIAYPTAHTDNDLALLDEATGTLWAGDLVFEGRLPSLDGSLPGWLDALDALERLEPELVVPGHGAPGPWGPTVAMQRGYLEALADDVRAALARGDALGEVVAEADAATASGATGGGAAAKLGRGAALFALQHPTNVTRAYAELEWE